MNQILVTKKLYVTPELKKKKKRYKIQFMISIFAIVVLFSYYIYAEYDRNKSEEVSQDILENIREKQEDETIRKNERKVIVVALSEEEAQQAEEQIVQPQSTVNMGEYTANDGTNYTTESILNIPSLGINYPVLSETSEELLKISLNKFWGPAPNQIGNYCIVGHNYKNGKLFGNLSKIEIGAIIELTDSTNTTIKYKVYDMYKVEPDDVACTSQLTDGKREVTLITCSNYGTQRLIVKAREE